MSLPHLRATATSLLKNKKTSQELKDFSLALLGTSDDTLQQFTIAYLGLPSDTSFAGAGAGSGFGTKFGGGKAKKSATGAKPGKVEKDPNMPKRPLSAYFAFAEEERANLTTQNPGIKFKELTKMLGQAWQDLDEKVKAKYNTEAAERMEKWKADKAAYLSGKAEASGKAGGKKEVSLAASSMEIVEDDDPIEDVEEAPAPPPKPKAKPVLKK